ncbi:MAG: glycoside-pentoside-hexuronide (GPH):cation symporter [Clostridiales bacterium]|nr:glycoside-pentoside-hexuronide (GPH):cation symporter [Roseburia sp.]MDD7636792.1 glycoside-pentoside-hexuronide (GPH):cation symporter [Clostridiales bacterium]MDY4113087.1 glycoside-pentoside-hexuronide (GPH):cation symporter [Roseburia sp.]
MTAEQTAKQTATTRPFGIRDKVGYLFGDFGNDFTFILSSSFLMKFYTDVMGVDGVVVGMIMMIARFVDAFTDVTMGRICDRSRMTPAGKFKPWIRRMCGPVAIASFLIYQSSLAGMPMAFKIGYLFVTYILWGSIFYTSINIPYGSMASAISAEPGDRQSLSTFRTMGGTLAGLIIGAGVPMLAYENIDGNTVLSGSRFTLIAGVCSVLAVACYMICYALTTERVRPETEIKQQNNSVFVMLRNAAKNRALISIIVASIVMLLAQLTMQSMANYVYPNFYGNTAAQSASTLIMMVAMIFAAVLAKPLANKIGKAEMSVIANVAATIVCLILYFMRPESVWVYVAMMGLCWLGLGMFSMVCWALITDVIDYSELKNGVREDGSVYALYSFARKLGQAASAGLSGVLLSAIGYTQETAFETEVVNGIFTISTLVPAIGFALLAAVLWFWYPLHKKEVDANVAALKEKHGK